MGYIFHENAQAQCPHPQGQVKVTISGNRRVKVDGKRAATKDDQFQINGCQFMVGNKKQPCMTVEWLTPATKIKIDGSPAILSDSKGMCQSAEKAPQGTPQVMSTQTKAGGK